MSPTLLELVVALVLIVAAWQIGLAIAPWVIRLLRGAKRDVDDVTDEALVDPDASPTPYAQKEEHSNGSQR
jgi:hypothetical protein